WLAATCARGERGQGQRFEVAEKRHERECGDPEPGEADQDSRAADGTASTQGSGRERGATESPEHTADRTADGVLPVTAGAADADPDGHADQDRQQRSGPLSGQPACSEEGDAGADAGGNANPVPLPHSIQCSADLGPGNRTRSLRELPAKPRHGRFYAKGN